MPYVCVGKYQKRASTFWHACNFRYYCKQLTTTLWVIKCHHVYLEQYIPYSPISDLFIRNCINIYNKRVYFFKQLSTTCDCGADIVTSNLVQPHPGALFLSSRCLVHYFQNFKPSVVVTLGNNFFLYFQALSCCHTL